MTKLILYMLNWKLIQTTNMTFSPFKWLFLSFTHTIFSLFININHQIKYKIFWGCEIIGLIFNLCKLEKPNFLYIKNKMMHYIFNHSIHILNKRCLPNNFMGFYRGAYGFQSFRCNLVLPNSILWLGETKESLSTTHLNSPNFFAFYIAYLYKVFEQEYQWVSFIKNVDFNNIIGLDGLNL